MKNILKIITVLTLGLFLFQGCDDIDNSRFGDDPTTGWVEFQGSGSTTISLVTTQLELPLNINVPIYRNGLNISYSLEAVQGDFSSIVSTGNNVFIDPANDFRSGAVVLDFANLNTLTDVVVFDVVLNSVDAAGVSVGIDENSVTRFRVSTPCPIVTSMTYTGVESLYNGGPAPNGYTVNLTVDDADNNIYSLDTVWGPNFISTLCGGCVPDGDYAGPITFQVDPATFAITLLAGGEPAGVGNTFDLPYNITGVGSFNTCSNILTFDLEQDLLTTGGVPGTVDVVLEGN